MQGDWERIGAGLHVVHYGVHEEQRQRQRQEQESVVTQMDEGMEEEQGGKRTDALLALWDRLGFSNGTNRCYRTCGTYLEPAHGMALGATGTWIENTRTWFMNELAKAAHMEEQEEPSDEALSQVEQDMLEDDIASLDV